MKKAFSERKRGLSLLLGEQLVAETRESGRSACAIEGDPVGGEEAGGRSVEGAHCDFLRTHGRKGKGGKGDGLH